ncbi:sensor histidine kinase [Actinoplanes sp. L3-i22]|uniref:sensor histidine kinase n=1 Tax=Actinoplanes sp. L3-i22 TaxID=2836373 RepID=UPI001C76672F|nr:histidine kinase [Actinoplanes sp. L3-i22]BCY12474.1 two-component sensor histidine kinase [Actinoplanes sp. L3-i22]
MLLHLLVPEPGSPRAAVRDRLADAVAILLALLYGSAMMLVGDATRPGAAIPWPVDLALGVAGATALLVRRRHPLAVLVALLPFGAISVTVTGPILVALFTAAIRLRFPVVLLLGAVNVATGGVYYLLQERPVYDVWVDFLVRGVITVAALGWGSFVRAYRRLTTSLREHAARLEAEQELREEQARLAERARISREMHDVLAHRMSLISLHAGALEVRGSLPPVELSLAAGAIRTSAHEALEELRAVVGAPRGRPEPPQPGLADVDDLVASVRAAGMTVGFDSAVPVDGPPVPLGRTAYRIVQEGLTNARKHGSEAAATVRMEGAAGQGLRITIINPFLGTRESAPPGSGLGLVGIGERVGLAGGSFRCRAERGVFRLEAELPWPG